MQKTSKQVKYLGIFIAGILAGVGSLELFLQLFPVKSDRQFMANSIDEPVIRGKAKSIVEPIDWKFSQTHYRRVNNYGFVDDRDYQANAAPIAIIGDSYVQSAMLPYQDTIQGKLRQKLADKVPVYSFGTPMHALSGYLGAAEYAERQFQPRSYVFLLNKGDIVDSLQPTKGSYYLDRPDGDLQFQAAKREVLNKWLGKSALYRYVYRQIYFNPKQLFDRDRTDSLAAAKAQITPLEKERISSRLLDLFISRTKVRPQNTIFIIDSDREALYGNKKPDRAELSIFKQVAAQRGYTVLDTEEIFTTYYQNTKRKLDFLPADFHWNERANQLVVDRLHPLIGNLLVAKD
jgi:hypothetical protein